jgi:hypothetical protein
MVRFEHIGVVLAVALATRVAGAEQGDAAAARELLKQGYALKAEKKLSEALPVLQESYRLAPQLKTLINIADCLEGLLRYGDAQQQWVTARDRSASEGNATIRKESERRLSELEARMPRLTIVLSPDAPPNTEVLRDGVRLGTVSLGTALPTDPGKHTIVAKAPGRPERTFEVTLEDRQNERTEVAPGSPPAEAATPEQEPRAAPPVAPPVLTSRSAEPPPADSGGSRGDAQRWIGIGAGGLGVVAFGIAAGTWLSANAKHNDAVENHCPANRCDSDARELQSQAVDLVTLTNAAAITGALLIAGGAAVYFTAPHEPTKGTSATPFFGKGFAGVVVTHTID